ncbi:MAG: hypothetical protein ACTSWQ_10075 [Candidatus Thorarchaeota archaeon]
MRTQGKLSIKKRFDLKEKVASMQNTTVKVGFPKNSPETHSQRDGVTALFKATVHNFGLGVPLRPFMLKSFHQNKSKYDSIVKKALGDIENLEFKIFVEKLGVVASQDVKQAIIDLKDPPNRQSTVDQKGSSNPLIDSGHMMQSVTFEVVK